MTLQYDISHEDSKLIDQIVDRAILAASRRGEDWTRLHCRLDLVAVHRNTQPLRLHDLLHADDFNFNHDVFGIRRHLNRHTGELEGFFLPRFSARQPAVVKE